MIYGGCKRSAWFDRGMRRIRVLCRAEAVSTLDGEDAHQM